jgi:hypothetical protein
LASTRKNDPMERPSSHVTVPATGYFTPELEGLCGTVIVALNEHLDDGRACVPSVAPPRRPRARAARRAKPAIL